MSALPSRIAELRSASVLNFMGAFILVIPIYLIAVVVFFLLFRGQQNSLIWALGAIAVLIIVGFISNWKSAHDEWKTYEEPFETFSGHTHALNRELGKITGPALIVTEFIIGTVTNIIRGIGRRRIANALEGLDHSRVEDFLTRIRSKGTSPRFHPASEFLEFHEELVPLIAAEMVWIKEEGDSIKIGLNRKYDSTAL